MVETKQEREKRIDAEFDLLRELGVKAAHDYQAGKPIEQIREEIANSDLPDWQTDHIINVIKKL